MNERIRELEKQSYITFKDENSFDCLVFSKEKFAELIVRKCATIADQAEPYRANDLILKHFGVEE